MGRARPAASRGEARDHRAELRRDRRRPPVWDERDGDHLFTTSALTYAADVVALSALRAHLDEERELPNGTMSLHLDFIAAPATNVTVVASVVAQNELEAIVDLVGRERDGRMVLRGLASFSVRQKTPGGAK